MEREVGEIFDYKGKRLQVTKGNDGRCEDCFFDQICSSDTYDITGLCDEDLRDDGISVYFKEMNEIMTREEMKDLLPVMQAFADGKPIEYSSDGDLWIETDTPDWCSNKFYRIKPEPKYRPFKSQEECWNEISKHQPFGWVKRIDTGAFAHISAVFPDFILFNNEKFNHKDSFENYTFIDGAPFGIME